MQSWATELTRSMDELELKLKDAEKYSKNKEEAGQAYSEAVTTVRSAKAAVSRFVGIFDTDATT